MTTLRALLAETAADHGVPALAILNPSRKRKFAWPRQDFMWRAHCVVTAEDKPRYSYPQIARFIDRMRLEQGLESQTHHTTILHGVRRYAHRHGLQVRVCEYSTPASKPQTPKVVKTHCIAGHPLIPGNLDAYKLSLNRRECLVCARARYRAWSARQRAAKVCEAVAA